jgi:hypothetical protein
MKISLLVISVLGNACTSDYVASPTPKPAPFSVKSQWLDMKNGIHWRKRSDFDSWEEGIGGGNYIWKRNRSSHVEIFNGTDKKAYVTGIISYTSNPVFVDLDQPGSFAQIVYPKQTVTIHYMTDPNNNAKVFHCPCENYATTPDPPIYVALGPCKFDD